MTQKLAGNLVVLTVTNLVNNPSVEQGADSPDNWYSSANTVWANDQAHTGARNHSFLE